MTAHAVGALVGAALAPHFSQVAGCQVEDQVVACGSEGLAAKLTDRAVTHLHFAQDWLTQCAADPLDFVADMAARTHARDALRYAQAARNLLSS